DGLTVRAPAGQDFVRLGGRHWPRFAALHREEHQVPLRALGDDELAVGRNLAAVIVETNTAGIVHSKTLGGDGAPLPAIEVLCEETERTPRFVAGDQQPLSIGEPARVFAFEIAYRQGPSLAWPGRQEQAPRRA